MLHEMEQLSPEQQEQLYDAPVMITLLIAGADDDFDQKEKDKAVELAKFKKLNPDQPLIHEYYRVVELRFEERLHHWMQEYPRLAEIRNPIIAKQLEQLNPILELLSYDLRSGLYKSFVNWARQVAEASGGVLGYFSVGTEEKAWVELPMLKNPVTP